MNGHHRCDPEIVSTWLSLLVTLASSEEFTGELIAHLFPKDCGGCMVYSILMLVGCFSDSKNIQLAFDFFRHVLADPDGEILEMNEVDKLSELLSDFMTPQTYGPMSRAVCLEAHSYQYMQNTDSERKMMLENLSHTIEGLGVLCTSQKFLCEMKTNRAATVSAVKQSRMENKFSYNSAMIVGANHERKIVIKVNFENYETI
jgi:hypothetical protein